MAIENVAKQRNHPTSPNPERETPRPLRLALRWLFLGLTVLLASAGPALGQAAPCSDPEYRQFDFWLGEWEVTQRNGQVAGWNRIESIQGGCVLQENWKSAGGTGGTSFNMFFARDGKWHQTWVDSNGGRLDLSGGLDGKRMVLRGEMPGAEGGQVLHEIAFEPQDDGSVIQHWRASQDGGESWTDAFYGIYRKKNAAK